jgi:hypothetical protein
MNILLVEPAYYSQYPPLGLLKLSTLYRSHGHDVSFVRGLRLLTGFRPDEIKVTSLFTWAWRPVWEAIGFYRALFPRAKISLGGVYASLTPDHARQSGADEIVTGLVQEAEDLMPDYELVPEWHRDRAASILFSQRGCIRQCPFCAVPKLEGKPFRSRPNSRVHHLVHPDHKRIILWDNNVLGESNWREIFAELREIDADVDFNQGLDARLITKEVAHELTGLRIPTIRMAYDFPKMHKAMCRAIDNLRAAGLSSHRIGHICVYVLYNYEDDTPEDLFRRVYDLLSWGVAAYPMRYQPLSGEHAFEKDSYISPNWTIEQLNMVAQARRVIGYGGALPPYEGLINKFKDANSFEDAFELRSKKGISSKPVYLRRKSPGEGFELREFAWDLINMGRDHQFPAHALSGKT